MYKISVSAYSRRGNFREKNEDNFFVNGVYLPTEHIDDGLSCELSCEKQSIFCVFDGLGGEAIGEAASGLAAELMSDYAKREFDFEGYFGRANAEICTLKTERGVKSCGTTAVMAKIADGRFRIANIGDSPAYLVRGKRIKRLSEEHTVLQMLIGTGAVTDESQISSGMKNTLTQCLGMDEDNPIKPYISEAERLRSGDIILLCSDGLSGALAEDIIKALLKSSVSEKNTAEKLVNAAIENGTMDNVTAIVMVVKGNFTDIIGFVTRTLFKRLENIKK